MTVHLIDTGPDIWDAAVAFGSAIVGAAAAAIPAFMLAKRSSKEVLQRDREARKERDRSTALGAHVKLGQLVNSIATLKRQLDGAIANPPSPTAELWQIIEPVVGFSGEEKITFDVEELALFLLRAVANTLRI